MIRQMTIVLLLITISLFVGSRTGLAITPEDPKSIRIGVYIRSGFEACLETWGPTEVYLTQKIPGHDFMIVPLASREDIYNQLEKGKLDFFATNSAIYVCTEERFGTSALCSMVPIADPAQHSYAGSIIRKSSRNDLAKIEDIQAARFAAVKPWSFAGWIMQRQILEHYKIKPLKDLYTIDFDGTHQEVVQAVLDGKADAGAVAADILKELVKSGKVNPRSLFVFNHKGIATPLNFKNLASTKAYPNWVFAKTEKTNDQLAGEVQQALLTLTTDPKTNRSLFPFVWTVPENFQSVRDCLSELMSPNYASATEMIPVPHITPPGWGDLSIMGVIALIALFLFVLWRRARHREDLFLAELEINHNELNEVRASKNLIETILTRVECGIDIVDEHNELVYVAPAIEQRYGPWQGKKCHEYYFDSDEVCHACRRISAIKMIKNGDLYSESCCRVQLQSDHHPIHPSISKEKPSKLLQVPFYDDNGRWLYARVYLPPELPSVKEEIEKMVAQLQ